MSVANVTVTAPPGAIQMGQWPLLVWNPAEGARTEDHGIPVAEIAAAIGAGADPAVLAAKLGTTPAHVAQALDFATKNPS